MQSLKYNKKCVYSALAIIHNTSMYGNVITLQQRRKDRYTSEESPSSERGEASSLVFLASFRNAGTSSRRNPQDTTRPEGKRNLCVRLSSFPYLHLAPLHDPRLVHSLHPIHWHGVGQIDLCHRTQTMSATRHGRVNQMRFVPK